ncbi:MAG: hypothetical protein QOF78_2131 [Phycisphaerales bacterium]|nr:hypothetical protein [Phycisphaerales bacterium]
MGTATRFTAPRQTTQTVLPKLTKIDTGFRGRWFALILAGAIVSMFGPIIFGSAIWLRQFRGAGVGIGEKYHSWWWVVGMTCLWFLPILFFIEWITRGKLLDSAVEDVGDMPRFVAHRAVAGAFFVELCLWGPRMVTGGVRKQIGLTTHRHADRTLAAAMLAELLNHGEGMPIGKLYVLAKNDDHAFSTTLAYLMFHDLVDVSKKGDRVWLLSEGKRTLGAT